MFEQRNRKQRAVDAVRAAVDDRRRLKATLHETEGAILFAGTSVWGFGDLAFKHLRF